MASTIKKMGCSPRFWLVVLFFGLPLAGSSWLIATAGSSQVVAIVGAGSWDSPSWMGVPRDATTDNVVYVDGFESGTPCWWSQSQPPADCPPEFYEITIDLPGGETMDLVRIQAGTFMMGSPEDERGRSNREDLHQVTLTKDFYMGVTEVTQGQWEAVMGAPMPSECGSYGVGPDYPVYCVSWNDIAEFGGFVDQLNQHLTNTGQPGAGLFRLPTDAEWERAARGETQTEFSFAAPPDWDIGCGSFPEAEPYMWWCWNENDPSYGSKPVGSKLANPYGLHDMHGNLYEWVEDGYQQHLGYDPVTDPAVPTTGWDRVIRGGFWGNSSQYCRSAYRGSYLAGIHDYITGFRLARSE